MSFVKVSFKPCPRIVQAELSGRVALFTNAEVVETVYAIGSQVTIKIESPDNFADQWLNGKTGTVVEFPV